MNQQAISLGPALAAAFAVQQLLELLSSLLDLDRNPQFQKYKKAILGSVSLLVGLALSLLVPEVRILKQLGVSTPLDVAVTGLVLSAGTEGTNSLLKLLKYVKEDKKSEAASKAAGGGGAAGSTAAARMAMDLK